jgi:predicted dehydrogenase
MDFQSVQRVADLDIGQKEKENRDAKRGKTESGNESPHSKEGNMTKKYRVAIVGFGHMHINNVASLYAEHPQVQWAAAADTRPLCPERRVAPYTRQWNLDHLVEKLGLPKTYEDYREMLCQERPEIVIVSCENAQHPDVVEACAAVGAHVCVEKPMAASLADALRMKRACDAAGTTMIVNWPVTWLPAVRMAKRLIDEGAVGRVLEVKCRVGHTGPLGPSAAHAGVSETAAPMSGPERAATWWHQEAAGGGALLDFCCYGAMLARWYIGQPAVAALGMKANLDSQWADAEDNAAILVRFPQAMAVLEGSWTTWHHGGPSGPVVLGTTGTLVVDFESQDLAVRVERGHGRADSYPIDEQLPRGRANVAEEFVHHLDTGEPLHPTLQSQFNLEAMAVLDAGLRSARSGKLETVDDAAGNG